MRKVTVLLTKEKSFKALRFQGIFMVETTGLELPGLSVKYSHLFTKASICNGFRRFILASIHN